MAFIKHSKYRNPGILFELLVRQTTADLLQNQDSKAVKILKKYFTNTELGREYALYSSLVGSPRLSEQKADILISTVLQQYETLDRQNIDRLKFNLIKEIKKNYQLDEFFKAKIDNYKPYASVYTIFESHKNSKSDVKQIFENKITLLEHITKEPVTDKSAPKSIIEDLMKEDKEIRILAYKILVEKFNDKYQDLSERQKGVLKNYINSISDTTNLTAYLNEQIVLIKQDLSKLVPTIQDPTTKIKVEEVVKFLKPIKENKAIKDETLSGILQFLDLIKELEEAK
jgi:ribosomal protein L16 Arg81 hydroxylase